MQTMPIRNLDHVADATLMWIETNTDDRGYELRAGQDAVAAVRWQPGGTIDGSAADRDWTFTKEGRWQPRVVVRHRGTTEVVATFYPSWTGGGTLDTASGRRFRWSAANFWRSRWLWQTVDRSPVASIWSVRGTKHVKGRVEIEPTATEIPELALLLSLGWYLLLQQRHDDGTTAAIVAATAGS